MERLKRNVTNKLWMPLLLITAAFAPSGKAAVLTPNLNMFALTNLNADGSVNIASDLSSFVLTGGNTGSGIPGKTNFTAVATLSGTVHFDWSYASLDTPSYDSAGIVVGNSRTQLSDTDGEMGSSSFATTPGQQFGWYADTVDNTGEPGILTVDSIAFSSTSPAVPEPAGFALTLTGAAVLMVTRSRLIRTVRGEVKI